ncbi:hypothetical protein SALWKB12_1012 [Snodgrassella communis]|nr:hypothetical protein SALWKB12_1012 [Snodgrassella communis]
MCYYELNLMQLYCGNYAMDMVFFVHDYVKYYVVSQCIWQKKINCVSIIYRYIIYIFKNK